MKKRPGDWKSGIDVRCWASTDNKGVVDGRDGQLLHAVHQNYVGTEQNTVTDT